jgi:hypothetical protein
MAATSFGHVTTNDIFPPSTAGYRPIRGTIFDVLDKHGVTWVDYFQDAPLGASFRLLSLSGIDLHFLPLPVFLGQAAGVQGLPPLPENFWRNARFSSSSAACERKIKVRVVRKIVRTMKEG